MILCRRRRRRRRRALCSRHVGATAGIIRTTIVDAMIVPLRCDNMQETEHQQRH